MIYKWLGSLTSNHCPLTTVSTNPTMVIECVESIQLTCKSAVLPGNTIFFNMTKRLCKQVPFPCVRHVVLLLTARFGLIVADIYIICINTCICTCAYITLELIGIKWALLDNIALFLGWLVESKIINQFCYVEFLFSEISTATIKSL